MTGTIGFLGFGEAGRSFCDSLCEMDTSLKVIAFDIELGTQSRDDMQKEMRARSVKCVEPPQDLAAADVIFSAVTADQSLLAIQPLLPSLGEHHVLIDINSVSPARKLETARQVENTGACYIDMAVIAPVHPKGHRTATLIATRWPDAITPFVDRYLFDYTFVGKKPGDATAIKMVRSLFVKGLEVLTVETLLAAEKSGCRDLVLSSLAASYPGLGWPEIASYHFERTLRNGQRRAAEMRESAATLNDLGLHGILADAIADVQELQGRAGLVFNAPAELPMLLAATLTARRTSPTEET